MSDFTYSPPPDLATIMASTFTASCADGSVTATAEGDLRLHTVQIDLFDDRDPVRLGRKLTEACSSALTQAREATVAALRTSSLGESLESYLDGRAVAHESPAGPYQTSSGPISATVAGDGSLTAVRVEQITEGEDLGQATVTCVNAALDQALGRDDGADFDQRLEERISDLEAALERLDAAMDPLENRLDALEREL